jgi:methylmalonyl-CoA mutase
VKAAADGATLGEISDAIRPRGTGPVIKPVAVYRDADPFERIRYASSAWRQKHHSAPAVYVTSVGQYAKLKPRIDFAVEFFQVGGFDVTTDRGHGSADDAAKAALEANRTVVVLCGADDSYPEITPQFTRAVKAAIPNAILVVAGNPAERAEQYRKDGVDDFIFVGANACDILERICRKLGVM